MIFFLIDSFNTDVLVSTGSTCFGFQVMRCEIVKRPWRQSTLAVPISQLVQLFIRFCKDRGVSLREQSGDTVPGMSAYLFRKTNKQYEVSFRIFGRQGRFVLSCELGTGHFRGSFIILPTGLYVIIWFGQLES